MTIKNILDSISQYAIRETTNYTAEIHDLFRNFIRYRCELRYLRPLHIPHEDAPISSLVTFKLIFACISPLSGAFCPFLSRILGFYSVGIHLTLSPPPLPSVSNIPLPCPYSAGCAATYTVNTAMDVRLCRVRTLFTKRRSGARSAGMNKGMMKGEGRMRSVKNAAS